MSDKIAVGTQTEREEYHARLTEALKGWPDCDLSGFAKKGCKTCNGTGVAKYLMGQGVERVRRVCNCILSRVRRRPTDKVVIHDERKIQESV